MANDVITFEIIKKIGVIATYETNWEKQINLVSWNGSTPKIDIRDWSPDHQHMTKGITLTEDEACKLMDALDDYFGELCTSNPVGVRKYEG